MKNELENSIKILVVNQIKSQSYLTQIPSATEASSASPSDGFAFHLYSGAGLGGRGSARCPWTWGSRGGALMVFVFYFSFYY